MLLTVNATDECLNLAQLLKRARQGKHIVVVEDGQPVARFVLLDRNTPMQRIPGTAKGQIWIEKDFDDPLPEELQANWDGQPA